MEERNIEIPEMDILEIARWHKTIKTIVNKKNYLRNLNNTELTNNVFIRLNHIEDLNGKVDYSELAFLSDVRMLHSWSNPMFFKPTVAEVIKQIPKDLLCKTVAFELLAGGVSIKNVYKPELDAGYHVSIVRLYQKKTDNLEPAKKIKKYPYKSCPIPIGMTEEEFNKAFCLV